MKRNILETHNDILNTITILNNNPNYFKEINNNNFEAQEKFFICLKKILNDNLYFYYLNEQAQKTVIKFIDYYNVKELNILYNQREEFNNYISKLIVSKNSECNENNATKDIKNFISIDNHKIYNKFDVKNLKDVLYTEKDLISFLLGHDEIKDSLKNDYLCLYVVVKFINNYKSEIDKNDIEKISQFISTFDESDAFILEDYLNINLLNDLYCNVDVNTFSFYADVLNIFCFVKNKNWKISFENKDVICDSLENYYLVLSKDDFEILPSIINYIVSSKHFCFSLTIDDLNKLYNLINYGRFNIYKSDDKKFLYCDLIISKINMLYMYNEQEENNKLDYEEIAMKFVVAIFELFKLKNERMIKEKKAYPFNLYNVQYYERDIIRYLADPNIIYNNEVVKDTLHNNYLVDLAIIYLLNVKIDIFNKEQLNLLRELINIRKSNQSVIVKNNKHSLKYAKPYKIILKKLDEYIENTVVK